MFTDPSLYQVELKERLVWNYCLTSCNRNILIRLRIYHYKNSTYVVSGTFLLQENSINNQPWHRQMMSQEVYVTEIHSFCIYIGILLVPWMCHVSQFPKKSYVLLLKIEIYEELEGPQHKIKTLAKISLMIYWLQANCRSSRPIIFQKNIIMPIEANSVHRSSVKAHRLISLVNFHASSRS